jgi:hypothetical protein
LEIGNRSPLQNRSKSSKYDILLFLNYLKIKKEVVLRRFLAFNREVLKIHIMFSLLLFIFAKPLQIDRTSLLLENITIEKIYKISNNSSVEGKKTLLKPHLSQFIDNSKKYQSIFSNSKNLKISDCISAIFKPPIFS